MASFQPSGALYDGVGVSPDIEVRKRPLDWLRRTDTVLEAAIEHLTKASPADGGAPAEDGGAPADGGAPGVDGGGSAADGGASSDGGAPAPIDDPAGCECRASPGSLAGRPAAILIAGAVLALCRRRRRRRGR
jgi:hypothetical protein